MGFPIPYAGVVPKLLLTAAISMAALRDLLISFLSSMGLDPYLFFLPHDELLDSTLPLIPFPSPSSPSSIALQASLPSAPFHTVSRRILQQTPSRSCQLQCAVCLLEFAEGQEVKELPLCAHIFHGECIDGWLRRDQSTCPLCRSSIVVLGEEKQQVPAQGRLREQLELSEQIASWFMYFPEEEEEEEVEDPGSVTAQEEDARRMT